MRHGSAFGNQFGKLLHKLTATRNYFRWPAFAYVIELVTFLIAARKPARIQRHLDNDAQTIFIRLLERREWLLIQRVEKYFKCFALRCINDHFYFLAPIERNAIFADFACGLEFLQFLITIRSGPAVH